MQLWTIQTLERYQHLQQNRVLRAYGFDAEAHCPAAYRFMRDSMFARLGASPEAGCWPIWAWYRWSGVEQPRPQISQIFINPGDQMVLLDLEISQDRVLLSDMDLWGGVIFNCHPIVESSRALGRFYSQLKRAGFPDPLDWPDLDQVMEHPTIGPRMRKSWEKIFDLDRHVEGYSMPCDQKRIQATFWELKVEDVRRVERFAGA